jgi:hypothetical protein
MNGRDVATRMRSIEDNISGETGEDAPPLDRVVATLLGVDYDGLDQVLLDEALRVVELLGGWYERHGVRPTASNIAGVGFVQGVTFAVAAQRLSQADS